MRTADPSLFGDYIGNSVPVPPTLHRIVFCPIGLCYCEVGHTAEHDALVDVHRISLWHRQAKPGRSSAARVGQRSLSVTADTYTHVLLDDRELDHAGLVGQLAGST